MISSSFFFLAAKIVFFSKAIKHLTQKDERMALKVQLIAKLIAIKGYSFASLASEAVCLSQRTFNHISGGKPFSNAYFGRLFVLGGVLGFLFSCFSLLFVSQDVAQVVRIAQKTYWREFVVFPSVLIGAILTPLDFSFAHLIVRWASSGSPMRSAVAILIGAPVAYAFWAIGAGLAASIGLLMASDYVSLSFVANRIVVALRDPITSAASMQLGDRWFSYGLLSASNALSSLIVTIVFFVTVVLHAIPLRAQQIVAAPVFVGLDLIRWLDKKSVNFPIQLMAWSIAAAALLMAIAFRLMGL